MMHFEQRYSSGDVVEWGLVPDAQYYIRETNEVVEAFLKVEEDTLFFANLTTGLKWQADLVADLSVLDFLRENGNLVEKDPA